MIDFHAATERGLSNLLAKGILTTDRDLVIRGWNQWLEIHSGQRAAQMVGRPFFEVYPELRPRLEPYFAQALAGQVVLLSQHFHGYLLPLPPTMSDAPFPQMPQSVRIVPLREAEQVIGTLSIIEDVTERVVREAELQRQYDAVRRSESRYRFLAEVGRVLAGSLDYQVTLDNLSTLIVAEMSDWCIIDVVEGEQIRRQAATHRDAAKRPLLQLLQERYPPRSNNPIQQVLRTGQPMLISTMPEHLIESAVWDEEHLQLIHALGMGSAMMVPLLGRDRTLGALTLVSGQAGRYGADDLALVEEVARRAALALDNALLYREVEAAVQLRDVFFSIASHELKAPITTIKGYSDLLLRRAARGGTANPRDLQTLGIIQEESTRLTRLIDLLLDLSHLQQGSLELTLDQVDLCEVATRLVERLRATSKRHTLNLTSPESALLVEGDPLRLEQLLQNLLQNAIKYSPNGGEVVVRVEQAGRWARLSVSDQGIGIPEEARAHLFNSFYRAANVGEAGISGMGLGLYIVSRIVEAHGGTIGVTSELGVGSTFQVELPLTQIEEQATR